MQRLTRRDLLLIAVCLVLAAASIVIVVRLFDSAFPEASIDFRYDRESSRKIAERLLQRERIDIRDHKHAVLFDSDHYARIFLERSLGLERANRVMRDEVRVWTWHHRWFRPQVEEELSIDIAPTGELVAFEHRIPEDRVIADPGTAAARGIAERFLPSKDLQLVEQSERKLPKRVQRIFTWEAKSIRPAGAPYRHVVTVDGNIVTSYSQRLKVPDAWMRSYRELRSKNQAAGQIDTILNVVLMLGALIVFITRMRHGDLHVRFVLLIGAVSALLVGGVALNQLPSSLAFYDTRTSYPAFLAQQALAAVMQSLGTAMLLIVICGAGEVLYRQRFPRHLAIPKLWSLRAISSKRVFLGMILGYALVPMFIAYQVVFYLTAHRFGAWSPAELPYDDMLNTAIPWVAVLFAGFFPAFSEEFLSRAFAIPFLERLMRSRVAAIVVAGFVWGFGHAMYPNQPFWIRGVEVGIVGVVAGLLMFRFGLLPLLIWHYTIDAVYTATLLFRSGNPYYVFSAALASLLFAIPLIASLVMYFRKGGYTDDEELSNATLPVAAPPPPRARQDDVAMPPAIPVTRAQIAACLATVAVAVTLFVVRPPAPLDAIDYRITGERAKQIATAELRRRGQPIPPRVVVAAAEGFRSWNASSTREDGGGPGGFDAVAATHLLRTRADVQKIFTDQIHAGTYVVRFFTPMQKNEWYVEVDPRTARVVGHHEYLDEQAAGARLERDAAQRIATAAFDSRGFRLMESLTFQQPSRRDWLFHFEQPLTADAQRRVSVRVAGDEVTQLATTVRIPESVRRAASEETLLNVGLFALKIIGLIALLGLAIAGLVTISRSHGLPWRRPLRWTLALAIVPVIGVVTRYEPAQFGYPTTIAWETFRVGQITDAVRDVGLQLGLLFLAVAGIEAAMPYALRLRESRARFGRHAAVVALTAVAILVIAQLALSNVERLFPGGSLLDLRVSQNVITPLPALTESSQALLAAIIVSAAVALFAIAARSRIALLTLIGVFCATLDPAVTVHETPLMLFAAALTAAVVWLIGRYVLASNPLAWPLAIFLALLLTSAAELLRNDRADLRVNAIVMIAIAIGAWTWSIWRSRRDA